MTFSNEDERARITCRVDGGLKAAFSDAVDESEHASQSEALRDLMREYAERHGAAQGRSDALPSDPLLAKGLDALEDVAGRRRKVSADSATSTLAERLRMPKDLVKHDVLRPLEEAGHITPKWGVIHLSPVDASPNSEAPADD